MTFDMQNVFRASENGERVRETYNRRRIQRNRLNTTSRIHVIISRRNICRLFRTCYNGVRRRYTIRANDLSRIMSDGIR